VLVYVGNVIKYCQEGEGIEPEHEAASMQVTAREWPRSPLSVPRKVRFINNGTDDNVEPKGNEAEGVHSIHRGVGTLSKPQILDRRSEQQRQDEKESDSLGHRMLDHTPQRLYPRVGQTVNLPHVGIVGARGTQGFRQVGPPRADRRPGAGSAPAGVARIEVVERDANFGYFHGLLARAALSADGRVWGFLVNGCKFDRCPTAAC